MRRLRSRLHRAAMLALPLACAPQPHPASGSSSSASSSGASSTGGQSELGANFCAGCTRQGLTCDYWGTSCVSPCSPGSSCMCTPVIGPVGPTDGGFMDGGLPIEICQAACPDPAYTTPPPIDLGWVVSGCAVIDGGCPHLADGGDGGSGSCVQCIVVDCTASGRLPLGCELPARARATLAGYLRRAARLEELSVFAFEELATALRRFGAPTRLVRRAHRAARDERRHARLLNALELPLPPGEGQGEGACPTHPPPHPRPALGGRGESLPSASRLQRPSLLDLARANAWEGCIRETYGAAVAMLQARQAQHAGLRRAMTRIAVDEAAHAQLSWDLAAWFATALPASQERELRRQQRRALDRVVPCELVDPPHELRSGAGLPSAEQARQLWRSVHAEVWSRG